MHKTIVATLCLCSLVGFTKLPAAVIHVPGDHVKIQLAIDASSGGDTVLVEPGTYYENINFHGKAIIVASRFLLTGDPSFIASTIINGSVPAHPDTASCVVVISHETASTVLEGFTLTGGKGTRWIDEHGAGTYREGGGILIALSSPTIRNNFITDNEAIDRSTTTSAGGGGIRIGDGNPTILNNVIIRNRGRYGAGIVLNYTGATIKNNVIARNTGGEDFGGAGVWVNSNGPSGKLIENNTIADNSAPLNDGGGLLIQGTSVTVRNNIIRGNSALTGSQISIAPGASAAVSYCDVQGGYAGVGNINQNPLFNDTSYYLAPVSPCKDAGNRATTFNDPEDVSNPGFARFPSRGTLVNDIGAFGGAGSVSTVYVDLHLNDPQPPSAFVASSDYQTPHAIKLQWVDPTTLNDGSPLTNFHLNIYRDTTFITEIDSGAQMFIDTGRVQHEQYQYFIRTVIPTDSSTFDSAQAYAGGHAQSKPPILLSLLDASNGVVVRWKNPSQQVDGTPLNDLAFILIYRDGMLVDSVNQSSPDTAQQRTFLDTVSGFHWYRVRARDSESPQNYSALTDSLLGYGGILDQEEEQFEGGPGPIYRTGTWDTTSALSYTGTHSLTDSRVGNSTASSDTYVMLPTILLGRQPVVRFHDIAIVRQGSFAIIDISVNHRKTFRAVKFYDWSAHAEWQDGHADPGDWMNEVIDLSAYAGDTASIRFRLITASSSPADGWYIDSIFVGPADPVATNEYSMTASWNMLSLPLKVADGKRSVIFPSARSAAFSFSGRYVPSDSLGQGAGYWMKFDSSETFELTGNIVPKETVAVKKGWNMIGMISAPIASSGVLSIPPSIVVSGFYTFDSVYKKMTVLQPAKAYWLKSSANGKLILNSLTGSAIAEPGQAFREEPAKFNTLVFTDRDGHSEKLSFASDLPHPVEWYELPPLPPAGAFDIRFESQRSLEVCRGEARDIHIDFQSVHYPLSIQWNVSDESIGSSLSIARKTVTLTSSGSIHLSEDDRETAVVLKLGAHASAPSTPKEFVLFQNYPNPFNPLTVIRYRLSVGGRVTLKIVDILGREVATLVDELQQPGDYSATWDVHDAASGVYYYRLTAGSFTDLKKMVLLR